MTAIIVLRGCPACYVAKIYDGDVLIDVILENLERYNG